MIVVCIQEALLFAEVAEDMGYEGMLYFINIREIVGWSDVGYDAILKMAVLLVMVEIAVMFFDVVSLESNGVILILGCDQAVLDLV